VRHEYAATSELKERRESRLDGRCGLDTDGVRRATLGWLGGDADRSQEE
jgi:hypothetical protein